MKNVLIINLFELIGDSTAFGNAEGREVYQKLQSVLDNHPNEKVIGVSLKGVTRTDASFPRESVISLAKSRSGEIGFFLLDFESRDLMDNWNYAAQAKGMTLVVLSDSGYELIGNSISLGAKELLDFVMSQDTVTTSKVATKFDISAQNASAKLKKLFSLGLLVGSKQVAESGGMEFVYRAIH
ncbi:DNA-binding protein [Thalassolituus oleivorans]|uniref:DNA-binding protein n=1 Tax=Thalassolituus oleivorans TaxID=187493 RepID=UPI0030C823B5